MFSPKPLIDVVPLSLQLLLNEIVKKNKRKMINDNDLKRKHHVRSLSFSSRFQVGLSVTLHWIFRSGKVIDLSHSLDFWESYDEVIKLYEALAVVKTFYCIK